MTSSSPDPKPDPSADVSAERSPAGDGRSGGRRSEAGFVAVEWVAAVVFLLIPVVLIGAGVSRWPERQQVARAAAAEAARAAVLSDTAGAADANARSVAAEVATNYGVPSDQYRVGVDTAGWDWGEDVTVTVTMIMPTLEIPGVGSWGATEWSSSATQRIEDFRGLD